MGLFLIFLAILGFFIIGIPCYLIGTVWSICIHKGDRFQKTVAKGIDHLINVLIQYPANAILITKDSKHKFGNIKESMSGVLGKNKEDNTNTKHGIWWCAKLNKIEKNHVETSIDDSVK